MWLRFSASVLKNQTRGRGIAESKSEELRQKHISQDTAAYEFARNGLRSRDSARRFQKIKVETLKAKHRSEGRAVHEFACNGLRSRDSARRFKKIKREALESKKVTAVQFRSSHVMGCVRVTQRVGSKKSKSKHRRQSTEVRTRLFYGLACNGLRSRASARRF